MKKSASLLAAVLAVAVMGMSIILLGGSGAAADANAATCTTSLAPVGSGTQGAGTATAAVGWEPPLAQDGPAVVVPISPQGPQQTPHWSEQQIRNASTITNVARTRGLSPRAAVIAVATAMQESTLENLDHGDRDSVGLFQQRPSQGWGSVTQITDPVYAANKFYDGLVKIKDWQTRPLTQAAQAVQRSGFPDAYAKWEQSAGGLVSTTWGTAAVTSVFAGCDPTPAGATGTATDPAAQFTTKNPRTADQAIAAARAGSASGRSDFHHRCDNFVAQAYGWGSSGSETANIHWQRLVSSGDAHPGDNSPPPGALLFYDSGSEAGHVLLYLGGDMVASTDINGYGTIGIRPRSDVTDGTWHMRYRGWAAPAFPSAGGTSSLPVPQGAT
ncbi:hypothetical protein AB0D08_06890 [Kitasatospora sp. NPDC048540]|uniref:hypothetical protein n=1 Tax=Kitasatospora sp. NPDC048540 TaxID=3155634 RepID=UPI0033CB6A44